MEGADVTGLLLKAYVLLYNSYNVFNVFRSLIKSLLQDGTRLAASFKNSCWRSCTHMGSCDGTLLFSSLRQYGPGLNIMLSVSLPHLTPLYCLSTLTVSISLVLLSTASTFQILYNNLWIREFCGVNSSAAVLGARSTSSVSFSVSVSFEDAFKWAFLLSTLHSVNRDRRLVFISPHFLTGIIVNVPFSPSQYPLFIENIVFHLSLNSFNDLPNVSKASCLFPSPCHLWPHSQLLLASFHCVWLYMTFEIYEKMVGLASKRKLFPPTQFKT